MNLSGGKTHLRSSSKCFCFQTFRAWAFFKIYLLYKTVFPYNSHRFNSVDALWRYLASLIECYRNQNILRNFFRNLKIWGQHVLACRWQVCIGAITVLRCSPSISRQEFKSHVVKSNQKPRKHWSSTPFHPTVRNTATSMKVASFAREQDLESPCENSLRSTTDNRNLVAGNLQGRHSSSF